MMNETIKNSWAETKGKIKAKFGKLSDENIELLNGNLEPLSGQLQSTYGYAKEQADKESTGFQASLRAPAVDAKSSDQKPVLKN